MRGRIGLLYRRIRVGMVRLRLLLHKHYMVSDFRFVFSACQVVGMLLDCHLPFQVV